MSKLAQAAMIVVLLAAVPLTAQRLRAGPREQPAWAAKRALHQLPHLDELDSPARRSGIQPRPHGLRLARPPCECRLPVVSHQARVLQCRDEMRGLSRRHPSTQVRRPVRTMPYGEGLAGRGPAGPNASKPVSVAGRARGRGVRILSPGRSQRTVHGSEHGLRLLPLEELPAGQGLQPSGGGYSAALRAVPRCGRLARAALRSQPVRGFHPGGRPCPR